MYGVLLLKESVNIEVLGLKQKLSLSWYDGQLGVMPIFKDKKSALKLVDGDEMRVFKLQEVKKDT